MIHRDLLHLGAGFMHATAQVNRFRVALVSAAGAFTATQALQGLGHMIDKGQEFVKIMNQMRAGGWQPDQIAHARDNAFKLARTYRSVSAEEIMEMQCEMAPVLGNREEAIHVSGR
jgi:hypothetical protein